MISVFETALVEDGRIRLRERHLARLGASGGSPEQVAELDAILTDLCARDDQPFVMRVDVADEGLTVTTRAPRSTAPVRLPTHTGYDPELDIRRIKLADRSWAEAIEAEHGGDEVLLVSAAGLVGETTRAGVLVLRVDGTLVVPRLRGILASVTRSWAVDVTGAVEADVPLAELLAARGAAVLTAGRGVIPIAAVDDTPLARDPLFDALHTTWRGLP